MYQGGENVRKDVRKTVRNAALLALGLLAGCNLNGGGAPKYELVDEKGNPYCGGRLGGVPELTLSISDSSPPLFPNRQYVEVDFPWVSTRFGNYVHPNYQQGVLPNGLVPLVSYFEYYTDTSGVEHPFAPPIVSGWWNPPRADYETLRNGQVWTRQGTLVALLDPNSMRVVRASVYGWANNSWPTTYAAGPDGYLYLAGTTADAREMGDGTGGWDYSYAPESGSEVFLTKIDPETMEPAWVARLRISDFGALREWDRDITALSVLYDPSTDTVLVGTTQAPSGEGDVFRVRASDGKVLSKFVTIYGAEWLYWAEGGPASQTVYVGGSNKVCWGSACYEFRGGVAAEKYRLPPASGTGLQHPSLLWKVKAFDVAYEYLGSASGQDFFREWNTSSMVETSMMTPAPEGGLNFHVDFFARIRNMDFSKYHLFKEKAKEGWKNRGIIGYLGRISPDGELQVQEENLIPVRKPVDKTWVSQDSVALFLNVNGRTAVLYGVGGAFAPCYYQYVMESGKDGELNVPEKLGGPYGFILKRDWTPEEKVTGPDVIPHTNLSEWRELGRLIDKEVLLHFLRHIPLPDGGNVVYMAGYGGRDYSSPSGVNEAAFKVVRFDVR